MIRHIVFFSAKDPADVEVIRDGLMMLADIPHSQHFEVGRNLRSDTISGPDIDVVVYAEFADQNALDAYGQSGQMSEDDWLNPPAIDQRTVYEGNSILRGGRDPVVQEPKSKTSADQLLIE